MQIIVEHLHIVFKGNKERLFHNGTRESCVLIDLRLINDQVIKILLYKYAINSHIVRSIHHLLVLLLL